MKIFIDPGHNHSGADTGAVGNGLKEQDITYLVASKAKPILERCGIEVRLSRNAITDSLANNSVNASLSARTRMANDWGADLFVSIHCNAGGGTGTETYSYQAGISSAYKLAQAVQKRMVEMVGLPDRGVKTKSLYVLHYTNMPAILVETAFIDHKNDAAVLGSETGQQAFAEAIARGICDYTGIAYREGDELMSQEYEALKAAIDNLTETVKQIAVDVADLKNPMIYNYIDQNMPEWARPTIQKLVDKGALQGDENGLNLDENMLRMLVINDRMGLYE